MSTSRQKARHGLSERYHLAKLEINPPWIQLILAGSHSMTWNDLGGLRFNVVNKVFY